MAEVTLGLRTTIYKVPDLSAARQWYSDAFSALPYFDEPFYVGFNLAGYELGLMPGDTEASGKSDNVLSYWGVEDIEAQFRRFVDLGAREHEAPFNVGGDITVASVKDPWGNVIGLIYNPEFRLP